MKHIYSGHKLFRAQTDPLLSVDNRTTFITRPFSSIPCRHYLKRISWSYCRKTNMDGDQGCIAVSLLPVGSVGGRQGNGGKRAGVKKSRKRSKNRREGGQSVNISSWAVRVAHCSPREVTDDARGARKPEPKVDSPDNASTQKRFWTPFSATERSRDSSVGLNHRRIIKFEWIRLTPALGNNPSLHGKGILICRMDKIPSGSTLDAILREIWKW